MARPGDPQRFRLVSEVQSERDLHERVADALDKLLCPPALWFTYPAGAAQLSPQQQARYSRIGLKRGLPDIWILHRAVYCIELKRHGGRLSKTRIGRTARGSPRVYLGQEDVFPMLLASGAVVDIAVISSVNDMLDQLRNWDIPLRNFFVPSTSPRNVATEFNGEIMPPVSKSQQRFMGAELTRKRAGKKTQTGMSEKQLSEFATKPKNKKLPARKS